MMPPGNLYASHFISFSNSKLFGEWCLRPRTLFPFAAIVDLDKLKLAMIVNAVNPKVGGLLIQGPKGSGKTTAVRALRDILPRIRKVEGCPFNCNPQDSSNMCERCATAILRKEELSVEEKEMRLVDLPLGATEDRVVGSLDIEKAIKHGVEALEPGILAEANQNILYVDEINLLPDHIADDLLDAAATGWNVVEREGISVSHPSRFIFIGTMNPEEGQLRPQLLDRFPLSVTVERIQSVEERVEVVRRNLQFEEHPDAFLKEYASLQKQLKGRIAQARKNLPTILMPEKLLEAICKACLDLKVDGMRPDIVISKTARTLAAFEARPNVSIDDVLVASEFALGHRTREGGFLEPASVDEIRKTFVARVKEVRYLDDSGKAKTEGKENLKKARGRTMIWVKEDAGAKEEAAVKKRRARIRAKIFAFMSRLSPVFGFGKRLKKGPKDAPITDGVTKGSKKLRSDKLREFEPKGAVKAIPTVRTALRPPQVTEGVSLLTKMKVTVLKPFELLFKASQPIRVKGCFAGKRAETVTALHRGRAVGWQTSREKPRDVHLPATIRTAARKQKHRLTSSETALKIKLEDVKEKMRLYKAPMTIVFLIDVSGSMLLTLDEVKEALLKLHKDAYRNRDKVGIVALKDMGAVVVQHPITNLRVVANKLLKLKVSGLTPLAAGMLKSLELLKEAKKRDRSTIPAMVIITDGSANIPLKRSLETGEVRNIDEISAIVRQYEDLAIQDVKSVTKKIKRDRIFTIVVNTNPHFHGREAYGLTVTEFIASHTSGSHHTVGRLTSGPELVENLMERIAEDQRLIAHEAHLKTFD